MTTIDPVYVKSLEDENQSLRDKLAKTEEELDKLKAPDPSNTLFTIQKNQNAALGWSSSTITASTMFDGCSTMSSTISIPGMTLIDKEKADFITTFYDSYTKFKKATLWKKLKMLFSTIKTSKKE